MRKIIIILFLFLPLNIYAEDLNFPEITSKYAIIYDLTTDEVIYAKNDFEETSIASLTKILTTITALEKITDLNATITITEDMLSGIYWNASRAGLNIGDTVTYEDLLYATILPSGADAAQVLALSLSPSIPDFVSSMNTLASSIGMKHSNFVNITGLDALNHYSTAYDLALLLDYALKNPTFKKIFTTKTYTLTSGLTVNSTLNYYTEEFDTSRILGSKTGTTDDAGLCLSSLFNFLDHEMVVITLNAPLNSSLNVVDSLSLITFLDNNYQFPEPEIESPEEVTSEENITVIPSESNSNTPYNYSIYIPFVFLFLLLILCFISLFSKPKKNKRKKTKSRHH